MDIDKKINLLNKTVIKNQNKIRYLRTRDDIIGFLPSFILVGSLTTISFKNLNNQVIQDFYPIFFIGSLIIGGIPSCYLPTNKTKDKIKKYRYNIKKAIDELHSIALEENKKYN